MLVDLNQAAASPFDGVADYVVCGGGVAGIVLALELQKHSNVVILEAGGQQPAWDSQEIYRGEIVGRPYFDLAATRLRYFGGSSNHWGGMCRPLEPWDFEPRPVQGGAGWPIRHADLAPHEARAREILNVGEPFELAAGPYDSIEARIAAVCGLRPIRFWTGPPLHLGPKYADALTASPNVRCVLNANVTDIRLTDNHDAVAHFEVRDYAGRAFQVRAKTFVLAAGGIENPRILLNCDSQVPGGVGNGAGLVGRFFAEHPHHRVGRFLFEDGNRERLLDEWPGNALRAGRYYAPTPEFMDREGILNFGLRLVPVRSAYPGTFRSTLKDLICASSTVEGLAEAITSREIDCFDGEVRIASEQAPNPDSAVRLGEERDRFGMRRAALDWRLSPIDRRTIRKAALTFAAAFAKADGGRVRLEDWILDEEADLPVLGTDEVGGNHHMCTTRMGSGPHEGVVDARQRVFGIDNLFVAGSSVFATAGHANPTFTIVQTTLRLAEHLRTRA